MSLWTSLEPASATVRPGDSVQVRLRLRNTGDVVDEYRFEPVGEVAPWAVVEPAVLRLFPGTTGTVDLTFAPPRTPDATAGPTPYAVRVTPTEHPEAVVVSEGNVTVLPFTEVRAELVPPTVKGRFRGRPRLAVDNLGNAPLIASLSGSDNGDQLSYDLRPSNVRVEPGRAAFVKVALRPKGIIWFGGKQERPFSLAVQRSGREPVPVEGTYVQRGFLPGWLAALLGAAVALAIAFGVLWISYGPEVTSLATEQVSEVGEVLDLLPTEPPAVPPTEPPPPPAEPVEESEEPEPPVEEEAGGEGEALSEEEDHGLPGDIVLMNSATWRCADVSGEESTQRVPVHESPCELTDALRWNLEVTHPDQGPDGQPLFALRHVASDFCMDLPGTEGAKAGTPVLQYRCVPRLDDNQLWWLDNQGEHLHWIRNFASDDLCLSAGAEHSGTDDFPHTIEDCTDLPGQEWVLMDPDSDEVY